MIIRNCDHKFPDRLRKLSQPPSELHVAGTLPTSSLVAIVGSRAALISSMDHARNLAQRVGELGYGVISGGALGIDRAAHEGALLARAPTVAVLGTGLDDLYPARNRDLFGDIVASGGALVSPFAPGTPPRRWHFPSRNRLIAAWSEIVVVVEAGAKSGSLTTAAAACALGIPIAAFPCGKGFSELLRIGAIAVHSIGDVVSILRGEKVCAMSHAESPEERQIIAAIVDRPRTLGELHETIGIGAGALAGILLRLELRGIAVLDSVGRYRATKV